MYTLGRTILQEMSVAPSSALKVSVQLTTRNRHIIANHENATFHIYKAKLENAAPRRIEAVEPTSSTDRSRRQNGAITGASLGEQCSWS